MQGTQLHRVYNYNYGYTILPKIDTKLYETYIYNENIVQMGTTIYSQFYRNTAVTIWNLIRIFFFRKLYILHIFHLTLLTFHKQFIWCVESEFCSLLSFRKTNLMQNVLHSHIRRWNVSFCLVQWPRLMLRSSVVPG